MKTETQINKILSIYLESNGNIRPHFFLTGATGSGKTYVITKLAEVHGIPVLNINMAQITNEGIAGNSLSKVLSPLHDYQGAPVIVFFDEFDKAISNESETTAGTVQQELLKILEDTSTDVFGNYGKYNRVQTDNVLFVFAGSFGGADISELSALLDHGVKTELLGRVGLHFKTKKISLAQLTTLVEQSPLIEAYCSVMTNVKKETAIKAISAELELQYDNNIIGIRIINSLAHQYFINGGFIEVTKRTKSIKEKRTVRDISFS